MQFLCIGINENADDVMQSLTNELKQTIIPKLDYTIKQENTDGSTSIVFSMDDEIYKHQSMQSYQQLVVHISNALADYIITKYEEKLIMRIIHSNYCYFNMPEKRDILGIALKIIRCEDSNFLNSIFRIRRKNVILRKLLDYFENSSNLILDGFVNFRLKDYMKDLEEIVDKAVDDFLMEREYKEFIRLLKYFVEIQESKFDTIHVIVGDEGKYTLADGNKRDITNECIREFANEITEGEVNYDDLLVSSLITLAPKKIVIHCTGQFKNKELLETIKHVFSGKVLLCNGCEQCAIIFANSEKR